MDFKNSYQRKKATNNLISLFVINTIVLFFLSIALFTYLKSSSIENYFKENVTVNIYLKNSSRDNDVKQINKFLNLNENVKSIEFISKEDAAELFANEIGEEFVGFLGYNPLLDLISVRLFGDKIDIYNIEEFIESLDNFEFIEEVEYDQSHIAGGISKINTADNLIGIFTSRAMRERGRYQIQLIKTRSSGGVGSKIDLAFDIDKLRITNLDDDEMDAPVESPTNLMSTIKTRTSTVNEKSESAVVAEKTEVTKNLRDLMKRQREMGSFDD